MATFQDDNDRIQFFFADPKQPLQTHRRDGVVSVLYLLRRELVETLGYDPERDSEADVDQGGSKARLFASLILMFTVIDLLAKFMFGDTGKVGQRFLDFLQHQDTAEQDPHSARLLYAVRNSLVHAFNVPGTKSLVDLGLRSIALAQRKEFQRDDIHGLVTVEGRGDVAVVYVDGVYRLVITAIEHYRSSLYGAESGPARTAFFAAFGQYGTLGMA